VKYNFETYGESKVNEPLMLVELYESGEFGHVYIRPVYKRFPPAGEERYEFYNDYVCNKEYILGSFEITCQYNLRSSQPSDKIRVPYAWETSYGDRRNLSIRNIEAAEGRTKFLKKIEKALAKYADENGSITSFEEYAFVVSKIIGAKGFITPTIRIDRSFRVIENRDFKTWLKSRIKEGRI
jgi:hypothetical protein